MLDAAISNKACRRVGQARASRYHSRLGPRKLARSVERDAGFSFGVDRAHDIRSVAPLSLPCRGPVAPDGWQKQDCFAAFAPISHKQVVDPYSGVRGVAPDVPEARTTQPSSVRLIY